MNGKNVQFLFPHPSGFYNVVVVVVVVFWVRFVYYVIC